MSSSLRGRDCHQPRPIKPATIVKTISITVIQAESVGPEIVNRILKDYEKITLCKTSDRRVLGAMNEFIFHFRVICEMEEGLANIDMDKANSRAAGAVMKLNNKYIWPREMLQKAISSL
ncbi:MAG: hypothetical protein WCQ90_05030 [Deltaproteobacteria bacterium]